MTLFVKTLSGTTIALDVDYKNDTIWDIKQKIARKENVDINTLVLVHDGSPLEDTVPISTILSPFDLRLKLS